MIGQYWWNCFMDGWDGLLSAELIWCHHSSKWGRNIRASAPKRRDCWLFGRIHVGHVFILKTVVTEKANRNT